jgi:hypothetical protein
VVSEDAPMLWAVDESYKGDLKLVSAKIVKETDKQIRLAEPVGSGFNYRTLVSKDPDTGALERGARSPVEAVERFLAGREDALRSAEEAVVRAKTARDEALHLLEETKKGEPSAE